MNGNGQHKKGNKFKYRDYIVAWTGWKSQPGNECLFAQWIAKKEGMNECLHVCVPFGGRGGHILGYELDISLNNHWIMEGQYVTIFSTGKEKKEWQERGREAMTELIDEYIDVHKEEHSAINKQIMDAWQKQLGHYSTTWTDGISTTSPAYVAPPNVGGGAWQSSSYTAPNTAGSMGPSGMAGSSGTSLTDLWNNIMGNTMGK